MSKRPRDHLTVDADQLTPVLGGQTYYTQYSWGMLDDSTWMNSGLNRPAEPVPCVWQSEKRRRETKRTDRASPRAKLTATGPLARTILRVGDRQLLRRYYEKAFKNFQQINCRVVAKSYIKLVEPRKQIKHPYNGSRVVSGVPQRIDPQLTMPEWWPVNVVHREPDHLLKPGK